jgi:hypothetical protein
MNKPRNHILSLLLAGVFFAVTVQASTSQLPELTIDLAGIGTNQCRNVEWALPHAQLQVVICNEAGVASYSVTAADKVLTVDASQLRQQAMVWREKTVNNELANGILAMQLALDKLPQRSLQPNWRVLINHGVFGCKTSIDLSDNGIGFTDPCNQNRYTGDGRALAPGYPSLAIPPYTVQGAHLILGRLPTELAIAEALPQEFSLSASNSAAEQLVRAARWGQVLQADQLIKGGVDVNAITDGGSTALLIAVQMRQQEIVAFLIAQGANVNLRYPDGLSALKISRMVKAPELEAMLLKAAAEPDAINGPERKLP